MFMPSLKAYPLNTTVDVKSPSCTRSTVRGSGFNWTAHDRRTTPASKASRRSWCAAISARQSCTSGLFHPLAVKANNPELPYFLTLQHGVLKGQKSSSRSTIKRATSDESIFYTKSHTGNDLDPIVCTMPVCCLAWVHRSAAALPPCPLSHAHIAALLSIVTHFQTLFFGSPSHHITLVYHCLTKPHIAFT